jgi:glyoxylase-like metal-dependent hydrolase (beta-lactamase superfamily II)
MMLIRWLLVMENDDAEAHRQPVDLAGRRRRAAEGPALRPFTVDLARALVSLDPIDRLAARWVLPGHGDPWTGGLSEALGMIRGRGRD